MIKAVASRPVEQFETQVTLPDWQLEPDDEAYYTNSADQPQPPLVDENGLPVEQPGYQDAQPDSTSPDPDQLQDRQKLDQQWIDGVLGRVSSRQRRARVSRCFGRGNRRPPPDNRPNP